MSNSIAPSLLAAALLTANPTAMPAWGEVATTKPTERTYGVGRSRSDSLMLEGWSEQSCDDDTAFESLIVSAPTVDVAAKISSLEASGVWAELASYRSLSADWDSYDAKAPNLLAIFDAERFLNEFTTPQFLAQTKSMPLSDGGVALYWECGDYYIEVGFEGDGRCYLLQLRSNAPQIGHPRLSFSLAAWSIETMLSDFDRMAGIGTAA